VAACRTRPTVRPRAWAAVAAACAGSSESSAAGAAEADAGPFAHGASLPPVLVEKTVPAPAPRPDAWLALRADLHEAPAVDDDAARLRRLTARTFRWNEPNETRGYHAAEIHDGLVRWSRWSHVHGEGHRELGAQTREALERDGPPIEVPGIVLAQILESLPRASDR
jgi:hypothetical protein